MNNHDAKFTFYYLLSLVALLFTAIASGIILFNIVDHFFPDTLRSYSNMASLRFAISSLIVASPVYFVMLRLINQGIKKNELSKESVVRRWLSYLILFVSSIIILSSLISVLNNFLAGELSIRFALQVLSVFIVAMMVFVYYLYDIKDLKIKLSIFKYTSFSFLAVLLVSSFFLIESPQEARMRKVDQQTMSDIYTLESLVNNYYNRNSTLPQSIDELDFQTSLMTDANNIEYVRINDETFELCADFNLENQGRYGMDKNFVAGRNCFPGVLWSKDVLK